MAIKLFNKGTRTIDGDFKPQSIMSFTPEAAAKLQRLYGDELVVMSETPAATKETVVVDEAPAETSDSPADESAVAAKVKVKKAK
jgi:hypothetical protein